MESLFLDESRHPSSGFVQLDETILDVSHLDEPAVKSTVDERGLTTPAEGIAMLDCAVSEQASLVLEILDDGLVSVLDVDTLVGIDDGQELSILVDGNWGFSWLDYASSNARGVIVFTKARCAMDDTSTGILSDELSSEDLEAAIS